MTVEELMRALRTVDQAAPVVGLSGVICRNPADRSILLATDRSVPAGWVQLWPIVVPEKEGA